jgi:hypothetical protein
MIRIRSIDLDVAVVSDNARDVIAVRRMAPPVESDDDATE